MVLVPLLLEHKLSVVGSNVIGQKCLQRRRE